MQYLIVVIKKYRYLYFFITLISIGFYLFFTILSSSVNYNSLTFLDPGKKIFNFLPQGWAFFSRPPREAQIQIFVKENDRWIKQNHKFSDLSNYLGASRHVTYIMSQLKDILTKASPSDFIKCKTNYQHYQTLDCIPEKIVQLKNDFEYPTVSGEIIVLIQKPVPYAWSKSLHKIKMDSEIIRLNVATNKIK